MGNVNRTLLKNAQNLVKNIVYDTNGDSFLALGIQLHSLLYMGCNYPYKHEFQRRFN